jgi:hypothetical protein
MPRRADAGRRILYTDGRHYSQSEEGRSEVQTQLKTTWNFETNMQACGAVR